ncbi:disease resistance protein RPS6-like isoform X3 [Cucurbita pepo subsp. pepo]|uniref:disease resistance protein RPS6-like isoform X1 n=1 Tax=Cucurbita pepo subsp. pepo TaxID=3664 RepID=UPI000C9D5696|nr:disease resistance protein RPS6-like isoform X1 [Cucurbita pepo subsp. pepo]XP_023537667.1 disease resistance protein RPS6-like isoform X2 [Cucurbita pepo subsp. pepo]XP_023537668.1 disease resistance protein RPS6-like isoform X3 [Cucurbita pepo subsp. pepo]
MDSSIAMSESSALSPNLKWRYDVFLSFRGEDTRSNFTSHLDMALRQKGVNVFIDDKLNRGELISESLFRSIEEALISIVIFSENYASSSWCLDELVKIIECKKSKGQIVCPIFYKVDPSDVRKQTGSFAEALTTHQAKFKTKIQIWKDALTAAANLSGWNLGSRREADLIQNLVEEVLSILNLNCTPLYVAKYPVGIDYQLNFLRLHSPYWTQDEPSIGVYMVGIYGIGGIGKTTLAKALYNKIAHQFEACCFLSKVREASKQFNGLVQLQETLLHEILKEDLKVGNLDKGINIIRYRLRSKKVLIALDDVDKLEQLEALVGAHDWFGIGSMIIVTTRNNHLISTHEFDQKHGIRVMNHDHALELFSWHAFKKSHPPSNYLDLSKRATSYCNGHPLALVVLGSFLCTRAEQAYWKSILDEFENSLNKDINDILQISFDGLEEKEKEIFLDISCLLVGEKVDYVKNILNACHLNPDFGILVLMDLSLIMVENDKVEMHDLIRQMGYKIVNGESSEPGKRSRLWLEEDILKVFIDNSGTDAVKAIKLELPNLTRLDVDPRAFRKMKNLRLLMVRNARFSTNLKYLPDNLKWIKWHAFSQDSLPSSFITKNLVGLDLQYSRIQNVEKGWKDCKRLKLVDFSYSRLEKIPDFSTSSSLEKLYLNHCINLRAIPMSVVSLSKLVILDLNHCSNLKKLPSYLRLKSLKVLNLNYCKKLEELPNFSAVSNLEKLYLKECTNLRMIHESIGSLDELVTLDLEKCSNLKKLPGCLSLKSLKHLNLDHCKKLQEIPDFSAALNLQSLYLKKCTNLRVLHESIGSLDNLVVLDVRHCTKLEKLPSYLKLKSLKYLELSGCSKLEMFPKIAENMKSLVLLHLDSTGIKKLPSSIGNLTELKVLNLDGCTNLISVPGIIYLLQNLEELHLGGCSRFEMLPHKWDSPIHHGNLPTNPMFSKLTLLDLQHCNLSNADFLEILCDVNPFLNSLLLSKNKFCSLPSCLHKFMSLWNLQLRNCKFLQQIPNLPQCIQRMDATGCESLVRSPDNILDIISSKQDITLGDFPREFILMNIEIPEWFSHQTISNSIKVNFRHDHNIERTLATSAKFRVDGDSYEGEALISCNIFIGYRLQSSFMRKFAPSTSEYTWLVTTSSPTFSSSLATNDWNDVIVWFEVVKSREVNVTIRSCGVHLTDEVDGIQNDIKGQGVIYTDYDQSVELGSWDVIKSFAQEVSARSDCNAMLHAQNFPVEIDSKIQPLNNFPLHVTCYGVTRISGMEGMAETTLAKSIFDKLVDHYVGRKALNDWGGFIEMDKLGFRGGFRSCNTSNRLSSQKYLRVFDGGYEFDIVNDAVDSDGHLNFTRFLRIDDVKDSIPMM